MILAEVLVEEDRTDSPATSQTRSSERRIQGLRPVAERNGPMYNDAKFASAIRRWRPAFILRALRSGSGPSVAGAGADDHSWEQEEFVARTSSRCRRLGMSVRAPTFDISGLS